MVLVIYLLPPVFADMTLSSLVESSSEPRPELSAADSSTADSHCHSADRSPTRSPPDEGDEEETSPVQDMMMRALQLQMKPREKSGGGPSKEKANGNRTADNVSEAMKQVFCVKHFCHICAL